MYIYVLEDEIGESIGIYDHWSIVDMGLEKYFGNILSIETEICDNHDLKLCADLQYVCPYSKEVGTAVVYLRKYKINELI